MLSSVSYRFAMKDFRNAVTDDRVYVFDGAMGTMLYRAAFTSTAATTS